MPLRPDSTAWSEKMTDGDSQKEQDRKIKKLSLFGWFDRLILGAIFIGIILVGSGVIYSNTIVKEAVNIAKDVEKKADRNLIATLRLAEIRREADMERSNATIGLFLPVLLDIDEDIEQLKTVHNITRGALGDLLFIDYNGTHLKIQNDTTIAIPDFRDLLGIQNNTGTADIVSNVSLSFRMNNNTLRTLFNNSSQSTS